MVWSIISVVVAIIAAALGWVQPLWANKRGLGYQVISFRKLPNLKGGLTLTHDGRPVQDVFRVVIRIENTGRTLIRTDEYLQDLEIQFGARRTVLGAGIIESTSEGLTRLLGEPFYEGNVIRLNRVPLYRGDAFYVEAFVYRFNGVVRVPNHIGGLSIKEVSPDRSTSRMANVLVLLMFATAWLELRSQSWSRVLEIAVPLLPVFAGLFLMYTMAVIRALARAQRDQLRRKM